MSHAFYSDAAEKILPELTTSERATVERFRRALAENPDLGRLLPGPDAQPSRAYDLLPGQTRGRGITVVHRHSPELDAVLILWIIAGP
ncbi:hypothetical protein AB0G74_30550 [Streptomyces sp. NPDC020875]|uniref:hypothetical protein n=1 Tax=Streptomyces sp. NPDC020875 TaxID=3154898 RepID=UPI003404BA3D